MIVVLLAVLMTACQSQTGTVLIHTADGTAVDVDRSDLSDFRCVGNIDGREEAELSGDKAWQLYDYLSGLRIDANRTDTIDSMTHLINLNFEAKWNGGDRAEMGVYFVYDSGVIGYTEGTYSDTVVLYSCGADVYEKAIDMIQ